MNEKRKVLIVEDEKEYRDILIKLLEAEGIGVEAAANGRMALEKLETQDFDLIILDLLMPEMSGWNFMYELQKTNKKNTPIIILTNLTRASYPSEVPVQLDFMIKANVSTDEIVSRVKKHLRL